MEKASHKSQCSVPKTSEEAINKVISMVSFTIQALEELIETYGMEQVKYVVAYSIQQSFNDGRISKENKTQALQSQMNQGEGNPNRNITRSIPTVACWIYLLIVFRNNSFIHEAEEKHEVMPMK